MPGVEGADQAVDLVALDVVHETAALGHDVNAAAVRQRGCELVQVGTAWRAGPRRS